LLMLVPYAAQLPINMLCFLGIVPLTGLCWHKLCDPRTVPIRTVLIIFLAWKVRLEVNSLQK
jgi:hypothetical protein